ncbi:MAG: AAA family ATPase [Geminicoccaceae bacterium]|nr:AAA family ATPase [Geminicoccaceae bacterium]
MSVRDLATGRQTQEDRAQFRAFISDDETRGVVDQVIRDLVIPHSAVHKGGIAGAIEFLSEHRSPRMLLVDLSQSDLPLSHINELAEVCEPGVTVVAVGDRNDVGLFRELMNSGVSDYLVKPITPALLQKSLLSTVDSETRARQTNKLGRLVVVVGARGGVGATTVATNTAHHVAEVRRRRVALVDFDLQFGTAALALDLEPSHGFSEALETASRIDSLYVERTMSRYSDTLFVLSAEEGLDEEIAIDPEAVDHLMHELRSKFHYVFVDTPRPFAGASAKLLREASDVVLVADPSLASMRDTLRICQWLPTINAACSVTLLMNRVGENRQGEIPPAEFEKGVGRKIDITMPFDARNVAGAVNVGQPLLSTSSSLCGAIAQLSEALCGLTSRPKKGLLAKVLGQRGR